MPGKFGKVFQKRKSSGDVLEDVRPSFKVLERPADGPAPFTKSNTGLRKPSELRPMSEGSGDNPGRPGVQNRGSAGTQRSGSSYGAYNTSSSDRYSSSSTLPSAASIEGDDFTHPHAHPRQSKTMPAGAGSNDGFLRTAGRKFSFGGKKSLQAAEALQQNEFGKAPDRPLYSGIHDLHMDHDLPAVPQIGRARATTETSYGSETTVTQGSSTIDKLDFTSTNDDGFGDIFAGIGEDKRKSQILLSSQHAGRALTDAVAPPRSYRPDSAMPAPLKATRSYEAASPVVQSATSADGLMVASPVEERTGVFEMGISSPINTRAAQSFPSQTPTSPTSPSRQNRPRRQSKANPKGLLPRQDSSTFQDTDALLVSKSISPTQSPRLERAPPSFGREQTSGSPASTVRAVGSPNPAANPWADQVANPAAAPPKPPVHRQIPTFTNTPTSPQQEDVDQSLLQDEAFQALAISADRVQQRAPSPPRVKPAGKVMTPAQFERYRRDQAQRRLNRQDFSDSDDSKSGDEEDEEEEDDQERHKRMVKQRQKQEAQMSVYRQSMMKITGETAMASSSLRPPMDRNSSRLSGRVSLSNLRGTPSPADEEGEDDDVPLGILAAHGFPSKENNRPPNHDKSGSAAGIQYNSEPYPPPPQSVAGGVGGSGGALPAFARKLPQDPFFGASLVNQADRQSFALGGGDRGSVYGGSQAGASHSSTHLPPPGGLVGVIASEERARAIRRGSPAKTFGFGAQDPSGSMPLPPGVGAPPHVPMHPQAPMMQPPQPSVEQQANVQMAQQMTQMMQMQMQWMQQMMAMQSQGMQMTPQMMQMQQQMMSMSQGMSAGSPGQMPGSFMQDHHSGRASTMMGPPNMHPQLGLPPNHGGRAASMMGGPRAPSVMMGGQRAASMMMGAMGPQPGYTPSIAPSERSNIGQPSRYRPISTMPTDVNTRSRTQSFSSKSALGGFGVSDGRANTMGARPSTSGGLSDFGKSRVNLRVVSGRADDDEEEAAGWEEMRKKKESRKGLWRLRKSSGMPREKENIKPGPPSPMKDQNGFEGVFVPDIDKI